MNPRGDSSARSTSSSPEGLTQKKEQVGWFHFHTLSQDPDRQEGSRLGAEPPQETLRSLLTWPGTSNHQLHKSSTFSWGKERIMSCISTKRSSSRRERRFFQVQGGGKTHNTVIAINVVSGHKKMLSHSSKDLASGLAGHE